MKENYYIIDGNQTHKYMMEYKPLVLYLSHKYGIPRGLAWEYVENAISDMLNKIEEERKEE